MPFDWFLLVDRCSADITFNNFLLFSHTNQINSMLLWVCTVMDHRNCQNAVRTSVGCTLCASFMLLLHFDVIFDLLLPYLPVYNTRPCIIRTLIFDQIILKKSFQGKKKTLILPITDVSQW